MSFPYSTELGAGSGQLSRQPGQVREEAAVTGFFWVAVSLLFSFLKAFMFKVLAFFLVVFSSISHAEAAYTFKDVCDLIVEVTNIEAGEHTEYMYDDENELKSFDVKYTELTVKIIESSPYEQKSEYGNCEKLKKGDIKKYGLCQNEEIKIGDKIKGNTGGWHGGPECLVDVEFLDK